MSLVLILRVFCICRVYRGLVFFLLGTDSTYFRVPGDKGGPMFFRFQIFFGARFMYKLVYYNLYHVSVTQNRPFFMQN